MRLRHGPKSPARSTNYIQLIVAPNKEFIFFQSRNGPFIPTLRMLHRYPDMLPFFRVDRGAIRFVLSGANVMSPGLTSAGGSMDDVEEGAVVAIMAEEKQHALGIGVTTKSTKAVREENKGAARPRNKRRRQPRPPLSLSPRTLAPSCLAVAHLAYFARRRGDRDDALSEGRVVDDADRSVVSGDVVLF